MNQCAEGRGDAIDGAERHAAKLAALRSGDHLA
jgi:hypothetical protein